jgi:hypothetical protein
MCANELLLLSSLLRVYVEYSEIDKVDGWCPVLVVAVTAAYKLRSWQTRLRAAVLKT